MPRTRSKKIVIPEDETVSEPQTEKQDTTVAIRPPFAEIANPLQSVTVEEMEVTEQVKGLKAAFKTAIGVKKNKGKKKKEKHQEKSIENTAPSVMEDNLSADGSPAAMEAREILKSEDGSLLHLLHQISDLNLARPESTPLANSMPNAPTPSTSAAAYQELLNQTAEESVFNSRGGLYPLQADLHTEFQINRSPQKPTMTLDLVERECEMKDAISPRADSGDDEDSFVDQITCRSPAKPVSRIEDSVEALDKLEEAIEDLDNVALGQPVISPRSDGPSNSSSAAVVSRSSSPSDKFIAAKKAARAASRASAARAAASANRVKQKKAMVTAVPSAKTVKKVKGTTVVRDDAKVESQSGSPSEPSQDKATLPKRPLKRPASLLPPKQPLKSTKPVTRPTFELPGEAVARKLKEQREARMLQRESSVTVAAPLRVKSTKPPTVPTFELPGEALSKKKREQNEARLKAQEEEERQRREFKAKPLRKSIVPDMIPRETVASRARKSQMGVPEFQNAATGRAYNSLTVGKHGSNVGAHRPSILAANLANISAPRTPGPAGASPALVPKPCTTSGPSMSGLATQRSVSASNAQTQRQRAKDIYNREARLLEAQEKEKREREAAAKKSREEAAERGRQASREWAEKQRAKPDKGLVSGYGPGGQMGLKA